MSDEAQNRIEERPAATPAPPATKNWLKRLGIAGFLFFLIKGLLWLIIPALIVKGCITFS